MYFKYLTPGLKDKRYPAVQHHMHCIYYLIDLGSSTDRTYTIAEPVTR